MPTDTRVALVHEPSGNDADWTKQPDIMRLLRAH